MSEDRVPFRPLDFDVRPDRSRKRTPAMEAVDRMFLDRARAALGAADCRALDLLATSPGISTIELTKQLATRANRGLSAIGLIIAIYDEAAHKGVVREIAKDLLIRQIYYRFPQGWSSLGNIGAAVKIGSWSLDASRHGRDPKIVGYARCIIRELAIDHSPPEGWKPLPENDPLIDDLFDRFWPVEPAAAMGES